MQTALYHFAHGAALAATGKPAEADADLAALKAAAAQLPKDSMLGPSNSTADVAAVAIADLTARIADAKGDIASTSTAATTRARWSWTRSRSSSATRRFPPCPHCSRS